MNSEKGVTTYIAYLDLKENVTEQMIVDFRRRGHTHREI